MNSKIVLGLLSVLIIGGAYLLLSNTSTKQTAPQPAAQPTPTQAVATPTLEVKQASEALVDVTENGFSPTTVTIKKGTKVVWTNKTSRVVTVNSTPHPIHTDYPPLNLGPFTKDASVELMFDKSGTYTYHNHREPSMTGTVIVE